jgi:hypothetical protein
MTEIFTGFPQFFLKHVEYFSSKLHRKGLFERFKRRKEDNMKVALKEIIFVGEERIRPAQNIGQWRILLNTQ